MRNVLGVKVGNYTPVKIDKRTKNGKKLDIAQVIQLKDTNGLSFSKIGKMLDYSPGYIHKAYNEFKNILPSPEILDTYVQNKDRVFQGVEQKIVANIADEERLSKANVQQLGNVLKNVSNLRRLEAGQTTQNIGVGLEIRLAKALEKSRGESVSSNEPLTNDSVSD